ncbi:MAG: hypothetical protein J6L86_07820, partial [Alphaproteobacteria bacterium]|nr:hypothetical protein [Alphaproteobacteria bacterium]
SSGSTSYSGSVVGYNECGSACRSCSTSCPSGTSTTNPGGCGGSTTNECGTRTCYYPYQSCHSHSYSCPSGYSTSCSDGYSDTAYKECSCGQTSSTKCYKCNAASSGGDSGGSTCNKYKSCSNKCTGVLNPVPHCQKHSSSKYTLNCSLSITRDWVNCSGQSKTASGTAYDQIATYSTSDACEAARSTKTCSCSSYRWPYDCIGVSGTISFD